MFCEVCNAYIVASGRGRPPRFCSSRCRVAAHRARRSLPSELTSARRWTRRDGKRPIRVDGRAASSTDPATWSSWREVQSGAGDGFGFMLGGGIGCYDLDHCFDDDGGLSLVARALIRSVDPFWVERSMSGDGLHLFVYAPEGPGSRTGRYEFYSRARFIAVTGDRYEP